MFFFSLAVFFTRILCLKAESSYEAQSRLETNLFNNYSKEIRPVLNLNENVTVSVGISLSRIQEMNDKSQVLTLSLWVRQVWYDPRLTWNRSDYAMTKQIHVDPDKIWVPDLKVYNEVSTHLDHGLDQLHTKAIVYSTGKIKWMSPSVKKLSCHVDMTFFPHDTQNCGIKIGSWTYDGYALDVRPESYTMDVSKSPSNPEWQLISTSVQRHEEKYKCCPEPYPDVTYTVMIKRRERSYWMNFIFPGVFLTVLTMMSFMTAAQDTGERISLVLTALVSMFFFLKLVSERTPASDTTPLLSVYFVMLSFEIGLILYSVCLSLNAYHKHPALGEMPNYVRSLVLGKLGNLWTLREDRERIGRRLGALEDLSQMKENIKNELENIKNGLSSSKSGLECRGEASFDKQCNGDCLKTREREDIIDEAVDRSIVQLEDVHDTEESSSRNASTVVANSETEICACSIMIKKMVKGNKRLLFAIRQIVFVARQLDKTSSEKENWLIAATILDRVFLVLFVICFVIISVVSG
ncbi:acetylcholine receptor subunit alpha-type acr-16-like [Dendronephthya gigantea]|uniref:acetylcholine receptor subunit alpha-type acr-16-like n=1 Tax=Dendronephthya gigantea TaxID=151771 RepID=UPI00106B6003|nr:acetylcholine receptor subunit alpha-type acr-16-like [Dendronephthya gigantea]